MDERDEVEDETDARQLIAEGLLGLAELAEQEAVLYRRWADEMLSGELTGEQFAEEVKHRAPSLAERLDLDMATAE